MVLNVCMCLILTLVMLIITLLTPQVFKRLIDVFYNAG